jgi:hypothetical protein
MKTENTQLVALTAQETRTIEGGKSKEPLLIGKPYIPPFLID